MLLFEGQVSGSESVALGTDHVHHLGQLAMLDRSGRLLVVKMSTAMPLRYEELKSTLEPARELGLVPCARLVLCIHVHGNHVDGRGYPLHPGLDAAHVMHAVTLGRHDEDRW